MSPNGRTKTLKGQISSDCEDHCDYCAHNGCKMMKLFMCTGGSTAAIMNELHVSGSAHSAKAAASQTETELTAVVGGCTLQTGGAHTSHRNLAPDQAMKGFWPLCSCASCPIN